MIGEYIIYGYQVPAHNFTEITFWYFWFTKVHVIELILSQNKNQRSCCSFSIIRNAKRRQLNEQMPFLNNQKLKIKYVFIVLRSQWTPCTSFVPSSLCMVSSTSIGFTSPSTFSFPDGFNALADGRINNLHLTFLIFNLSICNEFIQSYPYIVKVLKFI